MKEVTVFQSGFSFFESYFIRTLSESVGKIKRGTSKTWDSGWLEILAWGLHIYLRNDILQILESINQYKTLKIQAIGVCNLISFPTL